MHQEDGGVAWKQVSMFAWMGGCVHVSVNGWVESICESMHDIVVDIEVVDIEDIVVDMDG